MMPPSTRDIMNSVGSKYAVVVGISKKARVMSAKKELEEKEGHLADMVNHTLEDLIAGTQEILHVEPSEEPEAPEDELYELYENGEEAYEAADEAEEAELDDDAEEAEADGEEAAEDAEEAADEDPSDE